LHLRTNDSLVRFGWDERWESEFEKLQEPELFPARVAVEHRSAYLLYSEVGDVSGQTTGRLRFESEDDAERKPAVGDWVAVRVLEGEERAVIVEVLPRRTKFVRKQAGVQTSAQVVAANVDVVFVVTDLDQDLNPRRIERYLTLGWESGAFPVVVLTKSDLCDDIEAALDTLTPVTQGIDVVIASAVAHEGIDDLRPYLAGGSRTVAFVGSSGVGKSSLINALAGTDVQEIGDVRKDGKGRHTTTRRELILLPEGGVVLDTPGMRELQLWDASSGIEGTFDDITQLMSSCRFTDCSHTSEPGCAVLTAVRKGALSIERLESYRKLQRELGRLETKQQRAAEAAEKRRFRQRSKQGKSARADIYERLRDTS
jgi:ribosome biogenesis GTPase / thiamine phosphate phosphatase